jgi:predicted metalloprotease
MLGVAWLVGINPLDLLGGATQTAGLDSGLGGYAAPEPQQDGPLSTTASEEELVEFVSWVLDDLQTVWPQKLPGYTDAKLVLFRGSTPSACGTGEAAMGPFYCPGDHKVYIDLQFYDELRQRFGAPGDFAQAYVLAHEIGHHVQRLTGVEERVRGEQRRDGSTANELSVRMELQADCFAGVWAHSTAQRDILEAGDVEEGLKAAAAIGDDRIQKMGGREVQPESFTHGTSEQRMRWLRRGMESGDANACDTFALSQL